MNPSFPITVITPGDAQQALQNDRLIQPLWPGPSDTSVLPATDDMADPDGSDGATFLGLLGSLIAESGR
jgi:hypothetical protein